MEGNDGKSVDMFPQKTEKGADLFFRKSAQDF